MAVIWSQYFQGKYYEVRQAGHSIRLYTNGTFHSQYNPHSPVGGNLWDLLFIPAFLHKQPGNIKRILILGVGGGAVIQQLNYFLNPEMIVGVELDPMHIKIARRHFGVKQKHVQLLEAEAQAWLKSYRGPKFDLIIEDLFMDSVLAGRPNPIRAIISDKKWILCLSSKLKSHGVLVMNFSSKKELNHNGVREILKDSSLFSCRYQFSSDQYENAILAFSKSTVTRRQFYENLSFYKELDHKKSACKLNFKMSKK